MRESSPVERGVSALATGNTPAGPALRSLSGTGTLPVEPFCQAGSKSPRCAMRRPEVEVVIESELDEALPRSTPLIFRALRKASANSWPKA